MAAGTQTSKPRQGTSELPLEPRSAAVQAWRRLIAASSRLMGELDAEMREQHNFTLGEFDVLVNIENAPEGRRRMCDLAGAILLSASGLSRRVDRLERAGLVVRERGTTDGRNVEVELTPEGKSFMQKVRATHLAGVKERFASHFSEAELETLCDLLGRLSDLDSRP